jgi:hypothetical protein
LFDLTTNIIRAAKLSGWRESWLLPAFFQRALKSIAGSSSRSVLFDGAAKLQVANVVLCSACQESDAGVCWRTTYAGGRDEAISDASHQVMKLKVPPLTVFYGFASLERPVI